jgi:hypothetical protein
MVKLALLVCAVAGAAGCGSFEDPDIALDLRVLAMTATPPTQVIDVDVSQPPTTATLAVLLAELMPTQVCALVTDPGLSRRLAWSLSLCPLSDDDRCNDGTEIQLASGIADDPDTATPRPEICAMVAPDANLLMLLYNALQDDTLHGLGGLYYAVQLRVGGENADRTLDQYAVKTLELAPRIPANATANKNPSLIRIDARNNLIAATLPRGRCSDTPQPLQVEASTTLQIIPIEPATAREAYVVPTLDGTSQAFTETLTYQWVASAGSFSNGSTGGPHDFAGNPARLSTDYHAPSASEVTLPLDVSLWIIQRDERYGVTWYEGCVRVMPPR